jgi:hypothetical protein
MISTHSLLLLANNNKTTQHTTTRTPIIHLWMHLNVSYVGNFSFAASKKAKMSFDIQR